MNVRITYPGGRIDVFDTSAFASSAPFDSKNMLTDFEISLDGIEEKGLWLVANYYAAKADTERGRPMYPPQDARAVGGSCSQRQTRRRVCAT